MTDAVGTYFWQVIAGVVIFGFLALLAEAIWHIFHPREDLSWDETDDFEARQDAYRRTQNR